MIPTPTPAPAAERTPSPPPAPSTTTTSPVDVRVVDVKRDEVDIIVLALTVLSLFVGVLGVFLALVAYRTAKRESAAARRLIVAERGRVHELEVLRDLLDAHAGLKLVGDHRAGRDRISGLLSMLPEHTLSEWAEYAAGRRPVMTMSLPTDRERYAQHGTMCVAMLAELRAAIEARVNAVPE